MSFDGKQFGAEIVGVVKDYFERNMAPLLDRMAALETYINAMPAPKDGKDADIEEIKAFVEHRMGEQKQFILADIPELPDIPAMIERRVSELTIPEPFDDAELKQEIETLRKAIAELPAPIDGKDGRDGLDGKDGEPGERGENGGPGSPGEPGLNGKDGSPGVNGRDGLDAVEFLRGADGHLVVTLSNGTTRDLGEINGKDGAPGLNGKDGSDGLGFDDMEERTEDDGRTIIRTYRRGDQTREFRHSLPIMIYRGVYREGDTYAQGDTVTWGGHIWHCDTATADKPDGEQKCWTMAMRRARDGKDAVVKAAPEKPKV